MPAEMQQTPAIWFPTIQTNTGTDVFTKRLVMELNKRGIKSEISWLPLRAEYAPWTVAIPKVPAWATAVHVNTWLHPRFIPDHLPLVATIHHAIHHPDARSYKGWLRAIYHKYWIAPIERRTMRRADKVIAVSQFVAETARQTLIDTPMQVIYNGINTEGFRPGRRVRSPTEPFRLLYVGSWMARKGVDLLAPIMRELGDGFELRYTGGTAAEKDKARMPANMVDIGRLQGDAEIAEAMQSSDALLFPSRSEGFGLVAVEAMSCRLPVISAQGSSLIEVIETSVTGLTCPQDDVEGFASAVRKLAMDPALYDSLARAARLRVETYFDIKVMCDCYELIYHSLLMKNE